MKNVRWTLAVAFALACTIGVTQGAIAETSTFTGGGSPNDEWCVAENWSQGIPQYTERAIIPDNDPPFTVKIPNGCTGRVDSVAIAPSAVVIIESGGLLRLTELGSQVDSLIEGDLQIKKGAELHIENSLTIDGDDGKITGLDSGTGSTATITTASDKILTLDDSAASGCATADSLLVHGVLDIQAELVNDARVVADVDGKTLFLSGGSMDPKSGNNGCWEAKAGATLKVMCDVTGSNTWKLVNDEDSTIFFSSGDVDGLSGDFEITHGTLDVDTNLGTTGDLTFESTSGSHPVIEVASGAQAQFGG